MGKYLFSGLDAYDTPETNRPSWGFNCCLRSRWYFYFTNFRIFMQSGRLAAKGKLDMDAQIRLSCGNIHLIERCGGHVHIRGLNYIRNQQGRPAVIVGNHMSLLETAAIHALIREYLDFSFVVKESLLRTPYMRDILNSFNAIGVTRANPREDLKKILSEGRKCLESGRSMVVFPQATRSRIFQPQLFNSIGVKLAKSAGVPVIPLALKTDFVESGKIIRDLGPIFPQRDVYFEFGAPIEVTGNGQSAQQEIVNFIQDRLSRMTEH